MGDYYQFGKDYFRTRIGNDPLRQASFQQERSYIEKRLGMRIFSDGILLDVGCSTGEFIEAIGWNKNNAYAMELSEYAREIAEAKGIRFDHDLFNSEEYFDLIVFRGTIQYISNPFQYIYQSNRTLKQGGHILFLATPNTNCLYYRWFKTLPFLEESLNYWIPCDTSLSMVLKNCGFKVIEIHYPYLRSPYASLLGDHLKFVRKLFARTQDKFPFWRSSMTVLARKVGDGQ